MRIENAVNQAPTTPPRARKADPPPPAIEAPTPHAPAPEAAAPEAPTLEPQALPTPEPLAPVHAAPRAAEPLPERAVQALRGMGEELLIAQAVMIGHPLRRQLSAILYHVERVLVAHETAQAARDAELVKDVEPAPAAPSEPAVSAPPKKSQTKKNASETSEG